MMFAYHPASNLIGHRTRALAVVELLDGLRELILARYGLQLLDECRVNSSPSPTVCSHRSQKPSTSRMDGALLANAKPAMSATTICYSDWVPHIRDLGLGTHLNGRAPPPANPDGARLGGQAHLRIDGMIAPLLGPRCAVKSQRPQGERRIAARRA